MRKIEAFTAVGTKIEGSLSESRGEVNILDAVYKGGVTLLLCLFWPAEQPHAKSVSHTSQVDGKRPARHG